MMRNPPFAVATAVLLALTAAPAAEEERPLCPDRPGLDTPPCTVAPDRVQLELGLADWTLDSNPQARRDTVTFGNLLLRAGVADSVELRAGISGIGFERVRDRAGGAVDHASGLGDLTLGAKINLGGDGQGPLALLPQLTLPTGSGPLGQGTWSAGLLIPMSFDLGHGISLALTPELDAAADAGGTGRHLAYGSAAGLGLSLTDNLGVAAELFVRRDQDPAGAATLALAGLSAALQLDSETQLDIGGQAGLNDASPDVELYLGFTRRL